jgi:hypothetical protein
VYYSNLWSVSRVLSGAPLGKNFRLRFHDMGSRKSGDSVVVVSKNPFHGPVESRAVGRPKRRAILAVNSGTGASRDLSPGVLSDSSARPYKPLINSRMAYSRIAL